jgi:hypothetical protein
MDDDSSLTFLLLANPYTLMACLRKKSVEISLL